MLRNIDNKELGSLHGTNWGLLNVCENFVTRSPDKASNSVNKTSPWYLSICWEPVPLGGLPLPPLIQGEDLGSASTWRAIICSDP